MSVSALLVCRDEDSVRVLRRALDDLGIASDQCSDADNALTAVGQQKYDAVLVDCDDLPGGNILVRKVRRGASNKMAIVFAVTNGTTIRGAFDLGANFVLEKPLNPERVNRNLRAAHGLMMRERRRYSRQAVNVAVLVSTPSGKAVNALIVDVSEGGVSVRGLETSLQGAYVKLNFQLPNLRRHFEVRAEVSWVAPDTRAGLRFHGLSEIIRQDLTCWLAEYSSQYETMTVPAEELD